MIRTREQDIPVIYTIGELLVEIMRPKAGQSLQDLGEFRGPFPSGAPGIFISTAARLAYKTAIIGGVGRDKFGENIRARLQGDGVDCSQLKQSSRPTAVAFVAYDEQGEREFIYHIRATAADDLSFDLEALPCPDALHVMGCSLMASEAMQRAIIKTVRYYKNVEISFDPNFRPELLGEQSLAQLSAELMEHCSILLPGELELLHVAGMPSVINTRNIEQAVTKLFACHPRLRLINLKLGERGSRIYSRTAKPIKVPRYPIEQKFPVLDPTGAGDCFDAAFLGSVLEGLPLARAGFLAAKAGALNVAARGPMEGDMTLLHKQLIPEIE